MSFFCDQWFMDYAQKVICPLPLPIDGRGVLILEC